MKFVKEAASIFKAGNDPVRFRTLAIVQFTGVLAAGVIANVVATIVFH